MTKKEYFTYRLTTPDNFDRCIIVPKDYDDFPFNTKNGGSYNIAQARVCGLTYPDYLRFLMWAFPKDVSVEGKGAMYPVAYWKFGEGLHLWIKLLNEKLNLALLKIEVNKLGEQIDEQSNGK